ncbi:MAG: FecR family protein [Cyclobacteriaceae bacterium]
MKQYKYYSAGEFVNDLNFRSWVRNPSPEQDMIWQDWIKNHPYQRDALAEARAIVLAIHPVHRYRINDGEMKEEIASILAGITEDRDEDDNKTKIIDTRSGSTFSSWVARAASVTILIIAGWYGIRYFIAPDQNNVSINETEISPDNYMIERVNKSSEPLLISLPDNSSILLSQNSVLRYPSLFKGDSRNIFLEGTAFFEVTRDPDKPFYVNAGKIIAKVLGTSFEISTDQSGKQISVIVKSGTVSIYSNTGQNEKHRDSQPNVILTRHEQFILKDEVSQVQHTRLDSVSIEALKVPDTYLKFTATAATEVFRALARAYGVQINFESAEIGECSVTASFTDEPFPLKLELICRSIGVKYEIVNDQVTITGNGCEN